MRNNARGFSLIELMIAVTLGMVAVAAVGSIFIYGSRNYKQDDRMSRMQDELRFAMAQISQDIEMAGFWAQVSSPVNNVTVLGGLNENCGPTTNGGASDATNNWVYMERRAGIATIGNATAAQATAAFPCVANFVAGTDVLGIKRLNGTALTTQPLPAGRVYLRTNGIQTSLYLEAQGLTSARGGNTPPTGDNVTVYEYQPTVWYVRDSSVAGDNIPCLHRAALQGTAMVSECIATGIVNMQVELGVDTGGDGVVDNFFEHDAATMPLPPPNSLAQVIAVRVHLLARSVEPDPDGSFQNTKRYQLGSTVVDLGNAPDRYYRRTLSSIVLMRNQSYRLSPYALPTS